MLSADSWSPGYRLEMSTPTYDQSSMHSGTNRTYHLQRGATSGTSGSWPSKDGQTTDFAVMERALLLRIDLLANIGVAAYQRKTHVLTIGRFL